jgi:hypothetical protein
LIDLISNDRITERARRRSAPLSRADSTLGGSNRGVVAPHGIEQRSQSQHWVSGTRELRARWRRKSNEHGQADDERRSLAAPERTDRRIEIHDDGR